MKNKLKQKDVKKIIVPLASVIAIGTGAVLGLTEGEITTLESGLLALAGAVFTILGAVGVIRNNDKKD